MTRLRRLRDAGALVALGMFLSFLWVWIRQAACIVFRLNSPLMLKVQVR